LPFCPNCGSATPDGAKFCPSCGQVLGAVPPLQPSPATAAAPPESGPHRGRKIAILVIVLIVVIVVASLAFQTAQTSPPANLQLRSVAPNSIDASSAGLKMNLKMGVYNPNSVTASLNLVSYTVFVNGFDLGNGLSTATNNVPPKSNYTLTFPISVGWGSYNQTLGNLILHGAHYSLEIKGTGNIVVNGHIFPLPYDYNSGQTSTQTSVGQTSTTS